MRSFGKRATSTSRLGFATRSFIRSTRFVPPPRNAPPATPSSAATAVASSVARS